MTVSYDGKVVFLSDDCGIDDVEALLEHLSHEGVREVDVSGAELIHTALWQAMMMSKVLVRGKPRKAFYADLVLPAVVARL